jgi:hypothetical protein
MSGMRDSGNGNGNGNGSLGIGRGGESLRADMAGTGAGTGAEAAVDLEIDETLRLISSDKVTGTTVCNRNGETLGSIHGLMIDKVSGRVAYAVMSFGGFLGIGERYHPLPWGTLTYDTGRGGYVVDLSRDQLAEAPSYGLEDDVWSRPDYGRRVHDYYGLPYPM